MTTKTDLINKISGQLDYLTKNDADDAVNLILEYLEEELVKHNRIEIRGFGSFSIRNRKLPKKPEEQTNQIYNTIYFRPSKNTNLE